MNAVVNDLSNTGSPVWFSKSLISTKSRAAKARAGVRPDSQTMPTSAAKMNAAATSTARYRRRMRHFSHPSHCIAAAGATASLGAASACRSASNPRALCCRRVGFLSSALPITASSASDTLELTFPTGVGSR